MPLTIFSPPRVPLLSLCKFTPVVLALLTNVLRYRDNIKPFYIGPYPMKHLIQALSIFSPSPCLLRPRLRLVYLLPNEVSRASKFGIFLPCLPHHSPRPAPRAPKKTEMFGPPLSSDQAFILLFLRVTLAPFPMKRCSCFRPPFPSY